ncbi:MAG: TIGR00289 family protein, partial [Candidatus Bathyarchaeia archaeon]
VGLGFEFILSACTARGFTSEWLGRKIDKGSLNGLRELTARFNLNPAFEGGEAETFVTDSPLFDKRIQILEGEALWDLDRGVYVIKRAALSEKLFRS